MGFFQGELWEVALADPNEVNNLGMFGDKNQGFEKEVFFEDFVRILKILRII